MDERLDDPRPASTEEPDILTPQEARQGRLGIPVLYVLIVGLTLAFAAWAIVHFTA